ncbi:MAG: hypothetical protein JW976_02365 [Syntrophaceae bacterium]|nr:hypothetical protein [Syntrophaceae bacterium]
MAKSSEENKPFLLKFEKREGYLYAYVRAKKDTFDTSLGYWTDVIKYCLENGFTKLLVEEDIPTDNKTMDTYEIISLSQKVNLAGVKIAFVDRYPEQMQANQFGETVARNRGLLAKVFPNIKEAEEWLLS